MNLLLDHDESQAVRELTRLNPLFERNVESLSDHQWRVGELGCGVLERAGYSDAVLLQLIRDCGATHDIGKTYLDDTDAELVWGSTHFKDYTKKHITHVHQELGASHTVDVLHTLDLSEPARLRVLIMSFVQGNHHYIHPDPDRNLFSGLTDEARGYADELTLGMSCETIAEATELAWNINGVVHICDRIEALTSQSRLYRDPMPLWSKEGEEGAVESVTKAVKEEIGEEVTFFDLTIKQIAEYAAVKLEELNKPIQDRNDISQI